MFVTTPNHHHANGGDDRRWKRAKMFIARSQVCHDIAEGAEVAQNGAGTNKKVATQYGQPGALAWTVTGACANTFGPGRSATLTETHSWTDRANGGVGPRPPYQPAPAGMDWQQWIGRRRIAYYHADLHPQ